MEGPGGTSRTVPSEKWLEAVGKFFYGSDVLAILNVMF